MTIYDGRISEYITDLFAVEDQALKAIRQLTPEKGLPDIGIEPEEGLFLHILVRSCQALHALEIGTLGGYSGTWIARALQPGGQLYTIEKSAHHAEVARLHFELAKVTDRVQVLNGDAHQILKNLSRKAPFDFVFIDAEKSGYRHYFDWSVEHVRIGGVITAHNVLWGGSIIGEYDGEAINDIRQFNKYVAAHKQVVSTIFPAGDGTLVATRIA